MPDKSAPHAKVMPDDNAHLDQGMSTENGGGEAPNEPRQGIFDIRFTALTDGFGQACEQEGVETAIAIALHPKEKQPMVFMRGHPYDVAVLLTKIAKGLTNEVMAPFLSTQEE